MRIIFSFLLLLSFGCRTTQPGFGYMDENLPSSNMTAPLLDFHNFHSIYDIDSQKFFIGIGGDNIVDDNMNAIAIGFDLPKITHRYGIDSVIYKQSKFTWLAWSLVSGKFSTPTGYMYIDLESSGTIDTTFVDTVQTIPDSVWGATLNLAGDTTFDPKTHRKYLRKPIDIDSSQWQLIKVDQQTVTFYTYVKGYAYGIEEGYIYSAEEKKKLEDAEEKFMKKHKSKTGVPNLAIFFGHQFGWSNLVLIINYSYLRSVRLLPGCNIQDTTKKFPFSIDSMSMQESSGNN